MVKRTLAFTVAILTYILIVFGGYVASSESGMGCGPDWPLCNGKVIPILQGDTLIEFGHRVIGALLFILAVVLYGTIKKTAKHELEKKIANWMLLLLSLQLIMGAIIVFYHLPSLIISTHLLIAMVFLSLLIWYWRNEEGNGFSEIETLQGYKKHLNILILLLFFTMGIGAYVKHQHYGLACGWLSCGDSILPGSLPELLQTIHRLSAFISVCYILVITYIVVTKNIKILKSRMVLALFIIILQIIVGVITILLFISVSFAVLHIALAALLFAIIIEARISLSYPHNLDR
ncbi:COX15/CtaA family protein [Virgibacillus dakarensis]|uniref:COX15/CtaA family protein n=1 Tax=Virgibacillus dakarensis TaxID=1917889 RepID=UPI0013565E7B|nr:COX15/CtaA family protein [Virgibacillus dakarensis]MBT2214976.1 COX15/CtaA family protein [Virgibacillus dakarensis]